MALIFSFRLNSSFRSPAKAAIVFRLKCSGLTLTKARGSPFLFFGVNILQIRYSGFFFCGSLWLFSAKDLATVSRRSHLIGEVMLARIASIINKESKSRPEMQFFICSLLFLIHHQ